MSVESVYTIVGLDDITDFSINFEGGKEDFFDVLNCINEEKDVMTVFNTIDGKITLFSSGIAPDGNKEFLLIVGDSALDLLKFLECKYAEVYLDFELSELDKEKQVKSIMMLSKSLVTLAGIKEEDIYADNN